MKAVLLMTYGALTSIDDLPAFYTHIYQGKTPSHDVIEKAKLRFQYLGIADPLGAVTIRQAQALERRLRHRFEDNIKVYIAMKHTKPFIHDVVQQIIEDGGREIYTFPTSPLFSLTGTVQYQLQVEKALKASRIHIPVTHITHWHLHPGLVEVLSQRLRTAMYWISKKNQNRTLVIFTAHSQPGLPAGNQEFIRSYHELASALASRMGLAHWITAYRSATPGQTWLGPDVLDTIDKAKADGFSAVVVCELLSLTENVEALFDVRYNCQKKTSELGLEFVSTEFLNDSDDFMDVLEDILTQALSGNHDRLYTP